MNEPQETQPKPLGAAPWLGGWRDISTAPRTTEILVSWGSKASGHMGYSLAKWIFGKWVDRNAQSIEADGYCIVAWMALPNPPNDQAQLRSEAE